MMYKHKSGTIEKIKLSGSATFGFMALFCVMLAATSVIYTVAELIKAPAIPDIIVFIAVDAALILLSASFASKFKEYRALESALAEAKEEESEFSEINCVKTSAILTAGTPLGTENGRVQGFYITSDTGKKYTFLFEAPLPFKAFAESAPDLFGTLYVRKYDGTNLLCEIKKYP
jgi:hypothetical protein